MDIELKTITKHPDLFVDRHIGPSESEMSDMLDLLQLESLEALAHAAVPDSIRLRGSLDLPPAFSEQDLLAMLGALSNENEPLRSFIGMGYTNTFLPPVIQRNVLENPGWYTQYTPYQAEIAQGRLEALLNFQTVVCDLTGLPVANASLLDEGTAAAEAMALFSGMHRGKRDTFVVDERCHPQTIAVVQMRAEPQGINVLVADCASFEPTVDTIGVLVQYPTTDGEVIDYSGLADSVHGAGAYLAVAADLLALTVLEAPGTWGADVALGTSQRFGVPMGYGGPHAAFFAARDEFARKLPGRIIGLSKDRHGNPALRMALQTREQHIRREKATSNICTAQVLLANIAGFYAVYHGAEGLLAISEYVHSQTRRLAAAIAAAGHDLVHTSFFDTLRVRPRGNAAALLERAREDFSINLRDYEDGTVGITLDETASDDDLFDLAELFGGEEPPAPRIDGYAGEMQRTTPFLEHPVFHSYRSETEMLRYLKRLENKDLSLAHAMIPLGSCTMKLNATAEMMPITFDGFASIHPFVPQDQAVGFDELIMSLEGWLAEITGFDACSLQPNSGAMGEFTGLLTIRAYHLDRGDTQRTVCLIPTSAHGTNPASAVMAGMEVVAIKVQDNGEVDMDDFRAKAEANADRLGALMITYPSTHGVFERTIQDMADVVHANGGMVYMDGANMNAQVGLCRPGDYGMDVCHLNLHKTFAIPHGGGGPGIGPICVNEALAPFLPTHPLVATGGLKGIGPVAAAPFGSALALLISWSYIAMMGAEGLKKASLVSILNANYMARRLEGHYDVLYKGPAGYVAHEFILDVRPFQKAGVGAEDIAKRLIDYGFHAPTMSWPVTGTLMIEPTESESKAELDRFCDAMIAIRTEIQEIEIGTADAEDNVLKNAPHTVDEVSGDDWSHPYTRQQAAFPSAAASSHKFWPTVGRVDNAFGDRNLVCSCPPMEDYA